MKVISFHNLGIDSDTPFVLNIISQLVTAVEPIIWVFVDFNPDTLLSSTQKFSQCSHFRYRIMIYDHDRIWVHHSIDLMGNWDDSPTFQPLKEKLRAQFLGRLIHEDQAIQTT